MAKRVYAPKQVSPEIARENAISAAKAAVSYAQNEVDAVAATIAQWTRRGITEVDGVTMVDLERRSARLADDLRRAESKLSELMA